MTPEQDKVIRSRLLNGADRWLDLDRQVPRGHVLAAALKARTTPAEVVERLSRLGHDVETGPLPRRVLPNDDILVSRELNGWPEWLRTDEPVAVQHVLRAAVVTGMTPAQVTLRLCALGYQVPDAPPDSAVEPGDAVLMSRALKGATMWLARDRKVPVGHVLAAAAVLSRSPVAVAERLTTLGYRVEEAGPWEVLPGDEVLVSRRVNAWPDWLSRTRPVPVDHVLRAAVVTGRTPADVTLRLCALGYQVPDAPPDSAVEPGDAVAMSRLLNGATMWLDCDLKVPVGHVLAAAAVVSRSPAAVAGRLTTLGYRVAEVGPCEVLPGDDVLVSRRLNGWPDWLSRGQRVSVEHVLRAAVATGRTPADVAGRLFALGYRIPDAPPDSAVEPDDRTLLSRWLDGEAPWLTPGDRVPPPHVRDAAKRLKRDPGDIMSRLKLFGYRM
ncbi:hypothetical protein [Streptacidiphilus jiangxiensis]|uniref:wHTH-Hsp90 Na associated domain-containing protein n=1 Tax=Streptacidiphilus jiangxiensis TaxID=235985 RepID=A0A1H7ZJE4_STRJI|nr:hypothetical protein [Streptacidiphilus jiangxiensis]SEM58074.1 hypothetical protein SAMN05414137_13547 [Streptacidiphilus jiangxiensis]